MINERELIDLNFLKQFGLPVNSSLGETMNLIQRLFTVAKIEEVNDNGIHGTYKYPDDYLPGNCFFISTLPRYQSLGKEGGLTTIWSIELSLKKFYQKGNTYNDSIFYIRYTGKFDKKNQPESPNMLYIDFPQQNQEILVDMEDKLIGIGQVEGKQKSGFDMKKYLQKISFPDAEKIIQPSDSSSKLSDIQINLKKGIFAFSFPCEKSQLQNNFILPLKINPYLNLRKSIKVSV
jgi:hypothetical protein